MRELIKNRTVLLVLLASVMVSILALWGYDNYIGQKIEMESAKHLTEVYSQMKDTFKVWADKNWNLLYTWKSDIESLRKESSTTTAEEKQAYNTMIKKLFRERREKWKFSNFLFVNQKGEFVDFDGDKGSFELTDRQWRLIEGPGDYVVNITLDGVEYVMFVKRVMADVMYDFEYKYAAIIYSVDATMDVMNVESFDGNARCYITYADGECMFCDSHSDKCPDNILSVLHDTKSISNDRFIKVKDDFDKSRAGSAVYNNGKDRYYLIYVPTGVQDCMMVGMVPKDIANQSMNEVQIMSTGAAIFVAVIFVGLIACYFVISRRHIINEKNTKIMSLQKMFDILVENTDNVFFMFSSYTYEIEYISSNVAKVLGIVDEGYIDSLTKITELKIDGEQILTRDMMDKVREGKSYRTHAGYIHEKTGEMRWYMCGLYRTEQLDGKYVFTMCDRTKERENNMHIQDALELARSANKAKSGFLSNVSHDIRTPMNAIIGLTTLIQRDYDNPDKVSRYADKIAMSSKHLLALINDVLDMSKIESGKTTLNVKKFDFKELIQSVKEVVRPQAKAKNQRFIVKCDSGLRKEYIGDVTRIGQILLNLLSNAVKYTDEGGEVKLHFYESNDLPVSDSYAELCFEVSDNGCGMAPDYIDNVFEPFSRENNERTEKVDGAGLGLAVVKNIVDLMGGTISVESKLGIGTVFSVKIVLRVENCEVVQGKETDDSQAELEDVEDIGVEKTVSTECSGKVKVLAAEDYELNAEILVELLHMEDIEVDIATNGKEAVAMFERSPQYYYDYILMDVQMPIMNGYSATQAIRELHRPDAKTVKIIAMTANAFAEDVQKALDSGMDAHIAKPIDMGVLRETMKKL